MVGDVTKVPSDVMAVSASSSSPALATKPESHVGMHSNMRLMVAHPVRLSLPYKSASAILARPSSFLTSRSVAGRIGLNASKKGGSDFERSVHNVIVKKPVSHEKIRVAGTFHTKR